VGLLALLHHLAGDGYPGRAEQLAELGEVVSVGQRRDAESALPRALRGLESVA
jgi:hypothetical protein